MYPQDRRSFLRLTGAAAATTALTSACGSDVELKPTREKIRVGLLGLQEGPLKSLGDDQRRGFELYLKRNGGKLGGHEVDVIVAAESPDDKVSVANAKKLLEQDKVTALVGVIFSSNLLGIAPLCQQAEVPLISTYASTLQVQGKPYVWRVCALSGYDGYAVGAHASQLHKDDGVYLLASDYAAGWDEMVGFKRRFTGEIIGEDYIPFPDLTDFRPYLEMVKESGAGAVFWMVPNDPVAFTRQATELGLRGKVQFYSAEGLTELTFLEQQGDTAEGMMDAFYYSEVLDNAENRAFVADYIKSYRSRPYVLPLVGYDAAAVLDIALGNAGGDVSPKRLEHEIAQIGQIDSPRGTWLFGKNRAPVQKYYLRQVRRDGDVLANVVLDELGTVGDLELSPAKAPPRSTTT